MINLKKISSSWYFLIIILIIYLVLYFSNLEYFLSSIYFFFNLLKKIVPILILVFILMSITNYFFTTKIIFKYLGKKGLLKWFFVILGGILSAGPIYLWYPLLSNLNSKGLSHGLIACFLYNRAIKIPLIPLMIFYFSFKYILVLSLVMIFISIVQGIIINKLMEVKQ